MDHLASLHALPYAVHGYGAYFTWGLLDARYKPDMTIDQCLHMLAEILGELSDRFIIHIPKLALKLINENGISDIHINWPEVMKNRATAKEKSLRDYLVHWSLKGAEIDMEVST
jgi:20S proteasome alpha/beta subunit